MKSGIQTKQPPRFAIPDSDVTGGTARITGRELHHLRDVMRLRPGSDVVLCSQNGIEYAGRIATFEPDAAIVAVANVRHDGDRKSPGLILAAALIKAARMDVLVEKAGELDAIELWPLVCARSVLRESSPARRERWRRIAIAAAKQSLRSRPMEIRAPLDVAAMVRSVPNDALAVTCIAGGEPLGALLRRTFDRREACPTAVVLACGPEGDFTGDELAAMGEAGFVPAGLGRNRLRSETAALAALSIAAGIFDELAGS
jgi:16S rRNA (uracil1498-N3)-methyltransferase